VRVLRHACRQGKAAYRSNWFKLQTKRSMQLNPEGAIASVATTSKSTHSRWRYCELLCLTPSLQAAIFFLCSGTELMRLPLIYEEEV
jgi:hypothetical protein